MSKSCLLFTLYRFNLSKLLFGYQYFFRHELPYNIDPVEFTSTGRLSVLANVDMSVTLPHVFLSDLPCLLKSLTLCQIVLFCADCWYQGCHACANLTNNDPRYQSFAVSQATTIPRPGFINAICIWTYKYTVTVLWFSCSLDNVDLI